MKKILMAMVVFALLFTAFVSARAGETHTPCVNNLIVNGDFESGDDKFDTDYSNTRSMYDPRAYRIGTNPSHLHSAWTSFGDHTSGSGKMMIVNATCPAGGGSGCDETETPPYDDIVWKQTVNVSPYTIYDFSYWVALSYLDNPPLLQVSINGTVLGTYDANVISGTGRWQQVKYQWFSGAATSAEIKIVDQRPVYHGDDYALDDIEFCAQTPCARTDLIAGKYEDVGDVSIYFDNGNLYVTYTVEAPWCFTELHLDLASDFNQIPQKNGNPIPGKFRYKYYPAGGACETTYTFPPIPATCPVYIAAHAAVMDTTGYACTVSSTVLPTVTTCYRTETAWGEGSPFPGKNWAMYFNANACVPACPSP